MMNIEQGISNYEPDEKLFHSEFVVRNPLFLNSPVGPASVSANKRKSPLTPLFTKGGKFLESKKSPPFLKGDLGGF